MEDLVKKILVSMPSVKKAQQTFMIYLFSAFMVFQGRASMTHLSRYSLMSEKRFRRFFQRFFDFLQFNSRLLTNSQVLGNERIAAIDASFIKKSGNKTEGLGWFYSASAGRMQKGLETSLMALIDVKSNTAYALEAKQTLDEPFRSRLDQYADQVVQQASELKQLNVDYLVADAYYSKAPFVSKVTATGLKLIGKLRYDADLKWLYRGSYSGSGRPKRYDGKINFDRDVDRFDDEGLFERTVRVLSKVVYSVRFKRLIKVVMLRFNHGSKTGYALLYSTDTELNSIKLIRYYRARFQIEFIFRDAKQQMGLMHCQSRKRSSIHMHINSSLTVLNLLKVEDRMAKGPKKAWVISIRSCKQKKFNQHFIGIIFEKLGLDLKCEKVNQTYREMSDYGLIAA